MKGQVEGVHGLSLYIAGGVGPRDDRLDKMSDFYRECLKRMEIFCQLDVEVVNERTHEAQLVKANGREAIMCQFAMLQRRVAGAGQDSILHPKMPELQPFKVWRWMLGAKELQEVWKWMVVAGLKESSVHRPLASLLARGGGSGKQASSSPGHGSGVLARKDSIAALRAEGKTADEAKADRRVAVGKSVAMQFFGRKTSRCS